MNSACIAAASAHAFSPFDSSWFIMCCNAVRLRMLSSHISTQPFHPFESSWFIMCCRAPFIDARCHDTSCHHASHAFHPVDSPRLTK